MINKFISDGTEVNPLALKICSLTQTSTLKLLYHQNSCANLVLQEFLFTFR